MSILKRLEKLEAALMQQTITKWVRVIKDHEHRDETNADCIRRHGYDPDDKGLNFIIRVIVYSTGNSNFDSPVLGN